MKPREPNLKTEKSQVLSCGRSQLTNTDHSVARIMGSVFSSTSTMEKL